ncbi:hypothetical protein GOHSU_06_00280 [Gordonia hirsuta DSM 44140 = NBRC 16056]|uniref:DUF2127 domain-containing protein n=1 Tax=Gordonia hirsuta DSM 44140 = NBRC 16056 TaxID=1121927 RepID=L7L8N9_9ACTN|nr:DUF2127 domain-containing protein [Gordonia hirsuta]GAC56417.1 hypothetical protein GOHSU_06_00280 [Gordonia hirsuta DSM 44140 = NBRC 16056]
MKVDWELFACGIRGHETYRPDEAEIAGRVRTTTPSGEAWRCLRCGDFVPGDPARSGPAADAPAVARGGVLRDLVIMRLLAVDRFIHFLGFTVIGAVILAVHFTEGATLRDQFEAAVPRLEPAFSQLGWNVADWNAFRTLEEAVDLSAATVTWIGAGVLAYGLLELVEATGLWLGRRWGEYFSVLVTGIFIPLEIYELLDRVTGFKVAALVINVAAVIWLVWRKRLFGVHGGQAANRAQHAAANLLTEDDPS